MSRGGVLFFRGVGQDDWAAIIDQCFDLAYAFKQDPDVFLTKPIQVLAQHLKGAERLNKRLREAMRTP